MTIAAINFGILTIIFLIAGLIKPKWPLFFMEKPDRFLVIIITTVMIMIVGTLWGEGVKRHREAQEKQAQTIQKEQASTPEAVPTVPAPVKAQASTPTPANP